MDEKKIHLLRRFLDHDGMIKLGEPLSAHTSFGVGGEAEVFLNVSKGELMRLVPYLRKSGEPFTVIGNGSNLLISDKGLPGIVLCVGERMSDIDIKDETIKVSAGALLPRVAQMAAMEGLSGLEFAAGIPGTIGGAIVMNAGAYGGEMKDIVKNVNVILAKGGIRIYKNEECGFGYRTSRFLDSDEELVTEVTLTMKRDDREAIMSRIKENRDKRAASQPIDKRSAGSTFKRVAVSGDESEGAADRRPAWQLIEAAGCKGLSVGDARVSEKHCGFVVNNGNAKASDIYRLINIVKQRVKEDSGTDLSCEVRILGDFSEE